MSKKKAVLIFPDGVGIRNYLYSDVFKNTDYELIILHNLDIDAIKIISENISIESFHQIPVYKESFKEKFLRELICLSRLKYNTKNTQNPTILTNWNTKYQDFRKKVFYKLIDKLSHKVGNYKSILKLEGTYQKAIRKTTFYNQINNLFGEIQPDLIFCAHQRGLQCAPIFAVATDRNIRSATVIFSWDNLPKARMALRADTYLVWSKYMKDEMEMYYPEILADNVLVTGTPQFEFYNNDNHIIAKEIFFTKYHLDINKKIICFSGDDSKTSPDDPKYLHDLATEIIKNNLQSKFQILLRRCPVDLSGRFEKVVQQFPDLIKEAAPIWKHGSSKVWSAVYALPQDVSLLVSTVFYSDIVVNVGSTMAFDFAMFKKPCIFIAYDQEIKSEVSWSVETIYKFQHFKSMPSDSAVLWWTKKDEISNLIVTAKYHQDTDKWCEKIVGNSKNSSQSISKTLNL